jgi:hypothetical protein
MDQAALDAVRITAVSVEGAAVRVEADAAAAYPAVSGLTRFHRTFTFDGARTFTVADVIATREANAIQWFLHSDAPIATAGGRFLLGGTGPSLAAAFTTPAGTTTVVEQTRLTAPGRPGSITEGPEEERGYDVKLDAPAATAVTVRATLVILPAR